MTDETKESMIYKWTNGKLERTLSPLDEQKDFEESLNDAGFYQRGSPIGSFDAEQFSYELWKHKEEDKWIVDLSITSDCYQLFVEGLSDLLSLMNHLAPIVLSNTVSSDAMSYLENQHHKEVEKEREIYRRRMGSQ
jgi:hypothetical protein